MAFQHLIPGGPSVQDSLEQVIPGGPSIAVGGAEHATTGALAGQGATVSGAASRTRIHAASGALSGAGAAVVGASARTRIHTASGVLLGQGAAVAGAASRTRIHSAAGAIAGAGAALSGAAVHNRIHTTAGSLVGGASLISGTAVNGVIAAILSAIGGAKGLRPLFRGDSRTIRATIKGEDMTPVNVSGHTLWVTLKKQAHDPDPGVLQVMSAQPFDASAQNGVGTVRLESTDTDTLSPGMYYYDVQWVAPGIVKTVEAGRVRVKPDRTRSTS